MWYIYIYVFLTPIFYKQRCTNFQLHICSLFIVMQCKGQPLGFNYKDLFDAAFILFVYIFYSHHNSGDFL